MIVYFGVGPLEREGRQEGFVEGRDVPLWIRGRAEASRDPRRGKGLARDGGAGGEVSDLDEQTRFLLRTERKMAATII